MHAKELQAVRAAGIDPDRIAIRRLQPADRRSMLAIAARIWEGDDYLPHVFDRWVADPEGYFPGLFLDGALIGCGRLQPLDAERVWLESLRIDPEHQGQGLGRVIAEHVIRAACATGYRELFFATYFRNYGSIRISERAGFRRVATFTNLERKLPDADAVAPASGRGARPAPAAGAAHEIDAEIDAEITPGLPGVSGYLATDWVILPPAVEGRERFFHGAVTLRVAGCRFVLQPNDKYPTTLEICWRDTGPEGLSAMALERVLAYARQQGYRQVHTMVPVEETLDPYLAIGFAYFEQAEDVFVYAAEASALDL